MESPSPNVTRLGVRSQFPKVKSYLKAYTLGVETLDSEELPRLRRYAASGTFRFRYAPELSENSYGAGSAGIDLMRVVEAHRWKAIQGALRGTSDWNADWRLTIAYEHWHWRLTCATQALALDQFRRGDRPQLLGFLFLHRMGMHIANCVTLGWNDWAIELTQRVHWGLDNNCFNDGGDEAHRRTQLFVLRLIGDWQGWPERNWPSCAYDEPLFTGLLERWRDEDPAALTPFLLAACDRHTHQARYDSNKAFFDLPWSGMEYVPSEVLAVLRLRSLSGLRNPDASALDHPLMNTQLGRLPEVSAPCTDHLLEDVLARARQELPEL